MWKKKTHPSTSTPVSCYLPLSPVIFLKTDQTQNGSAPPSPAASAPPTPGLTASVTNEAHTDAAIWSSNARTERTRAHEQRRGEHKNRRNRSKSKRIAPKHCTDHHKGAYSKRSSPNFSLNSRKCKIWGKNGGFNPKPKIGSIYELVPN